MSGPAQPDRLHRLPWLDVVRALAALLVLVSHIRSFTLRDAAEQQPLSMPARLLFAVTGLGHEAVTVFFVLSGFLVATSMLRLLDAGTWSLARFGIERLTRLWVVLIPCLVLGGVLDSVGLRIAEARGTADLYGHLALTTPAGLPARDLATGLGNLLFLQTIAVPVWGSNGPLWSLAAEAWFYALAALAFSAWLKRRRLEAILPALALLGLLAWLPVAVLAFFPVWLLGAGCAVLQHGSRLRSAAGRRAAPAALVSVLVLLALSRLGLGPQRVTGVWLLGLAAAWLLLCAARYPWRDRWWSRGLRNLSALSYALYLSHVPVLALATTVAIGPHRRTLDGGSIGLMLLEGGLALLCAAALWWGFERHTPAFRRRLLGWMHARRPRPAAVLAAQGAAP